MKNPTLSSLAVTDLCVSEESHPFCLGEWVWVWQGRGWGESLWMNLHRNSERFWSPGRRERNNQTLMYCILSIMSAEKWGSGPRSFALSPSVCCSSGGWAPPLMGHFLLSFHIPSCIKMTNFTYGLGHRRENPSYWANRVSAEELIYGREKGSVRRAPKILRARLWVPAHTGWSRRCPQPQTEL